MLRIISTTAILVALSACKPTPFQVRPITNNGPREIAASDKKAQADHDARKASLAEKYRKAHSPTFAVIHGYYRLPNASPYGAATLTRGFSYGSYVERIDVKSKEQPFAVSPISGDEAVALNRSLNDLLDMGVKLHEISMTDAVALAHAEEEAMKDKDTLFMSKHLPPRVDYMMSIYKAQSDQGPVMVGRVIGKDGRLMAFRVMENGTPQLMLGMLIFALFEDSVNRFQK